MMAAATHFAYGMTIIITFAYQITKIASDMSDISHHFVRKGAGSGHYVSKDGEAGHARWVRRP
jgi:hypothetical protein